MIQKGTFSKIIMSMALMVSPLATAADAPQNLDELIGKSGIQRQIEQLPDVVSASFDQRLSQDNSIKSEEAARIKDVLAQSFNSSVLLGSIKEYIGSNMTAADIDAVLAWLNSPLGQKITKAEEDASSAEAYAKMQEFAVGLQSKPPAVAREELIGKLDQAARMTEFSTGMKIDMILSMTEAMSSATGKNDFDKAGFASQVESNRSQIEEGSRQEVLMSSLFTYQAISDEELQQYIDFYNTEAGKKYADVVTKGLLNALQNSSRMMGEKLGGLLAESQANVAPVKQ